MLRLRPRTTAAVTIALLAGMLVAPLGAAHAEPASAKFTTGDYSWTVPAGVSSVRIEAMGGAGGGGAGGAGGLVAGTFEVTAGTVLDVHVGGAGEEFKGGANGGGDAGYATSSTSGGLFTSKVGGGGGGSDVRIGGTALTDRVIVAGGGGGGYDLAGGAAGQPGIRGMVDYCATHGGSTAAQPGTQAAGGAGGTVCSVYENGAAGTAGKGALGANAYIAGAPPGSGGGGGYYGGGSGSNAGSGAGGSSYVAPSAADPTSTIGTGGAPYVLITWESAPADKILLGTVAPMPADNGISQAKLRIEVRNVHGALVSTSGLTAAADNPAIVWVGAVKATEVVGVYEVPLAAGALAGQTQVTVTNGALTASATVTTTLRPWPILFFTQPPNPALAGSTYQVQLLEGPTPITVVATGACSMVGAVVHLDQAGLCTLTASAPGNGQFAKPDDAVQSFEVLADPRTPTGVELTTSASTAVYSEPVTATATPTGAGTVQFSVDGTAVGAPKNATAGAPVSTSLGLLPVGDHLVTATFTPTDTATYAPSTGAQTVTVGKAASTTALSMDGDSVTATVASVAPATGTPSGSVTFTLDGVAGAPIALTNGVAVLPDSGGATAIDGAYGGDAGFDGSSDSVGPGGDPALTAKVGSAKPVNKAGWYRTPVTVSFTCVPAGAPLVGACPKPVPLVNVKAQTVTRTITASDGGSATVTVGPISVDTVAPKVRLTSAAKPKCVATDALSGIASCVVRKVVKGKRVTYTATALDKAGNSSTAKRAVRQVA